MTTIPMTCPHCDERVLVALASEGAEPAPDDRVTCPTHGDVGRFEDVSKAAALRVEDDMMERMFSDSGFSKG